MEFFIVTKTTMNLTNQAMDLINFFSQLLTVSFAIIFGLLAVLIILIIYKS